MEGPLLLLLLFLARSQLYASHAVVGGATSILFIEPILFMHASARLNDLDVVEVTLKIGRKFAPMTAVCRLKQACRSLTLSVENSPQRQ